jgi:hypothetical protein
MINRIEKMPQKIFEILFTGAEMSRNIKMAGMQAIVKNRVAQFIIDLLLGTVNAKAAVVGRYQLSCQKDQSQACSYGLVEQSWGSRE